MRNDLYVGALVALGAHAALALIEHPENRRLSRKEEMPVVEARFELPLERPEPPVEVNDDKPAPKETVARPIIPDAPGAVKADDFTVPVQPPVPPDVRIERGLITIPPGDPGARNLTGRSIFVPTDLDRAPVARFQARPQYPFEMRRGGISGEVLVEFIVEADGAVRDVRAVRSSQREFEDAAVQAVGKWKFRPGQKGGRDVATRMQVPIVFSLNAESD
jgi:protein TonB